MRYIYSMWTAGRVSFHCCTVCSILCGIHVIACGIADQSSSSMYPAWCRPGRDVSLFNARLNWLNTLPWASKGARYMSRKRRCDLATQQNTADNNAVQQPPLPFAFYPECHGISGWQIFQTLKQNSTAQVICNLEAVSICRSHARYVGWWSSLALQPLSDAQIYTWHGHSSSTTGTFGACIFSTTCQSKRWRRAACLGWWEMGTPKANSLTRSRWQERFVRISSKKDILRIYIYIYIFWFIYIRI